jgi:hypothetical protein
MTFGNQTLDMPGNLKFDKARKIKYVFHSRGYATWHIIDCILKEYLTVDLGSYNKEL